MRAVCVQYEFSMRTACVQYAYEYKDSVYNTVSAHPAPRGSKLCRLSTTFVSAARISRRRLCIQRIRSALVSSCCPCFPDCPGFSDCPDCPGCPCCPTPALADIATAASDVSATAASDVSFTAALTSSNAARSRAPTCMNRAWV
jgi:hypothetical protein